MLKVMIFLLLHKTNCSLIIYSTGPLTRVVRSVCILLCPLASVWTRNMGSTVLDSLNKKDGLLCLTQTLLYKRGRLGWYQLQ